MPPPPPRLTLTPPPRRDDGLAVLILAAGASRRLGQPKALVRLSGQSLVLRAACLAAALHPTWVGVVVGSRAGALVAPLKGLGVHRVQAHQWRLGLSASLRAGVRAAPLRAKRLLILSVDQWGLTYQDLRSLVRPHGRHPVAARYQDTIGIPACFPHRVWPALLSRRQDRGAKDLLSSAHSVALPRASTDLDTPAALQVLRAKAHHHRACPRPDP